MTRSDASQVLRPRSIAPRLLAGAMLLAGCYEPVAPVDDDGGDTGSSSEGGSSGAMTQGPTTTAPTTSAGPTTTDGPTTTADPTTDTEPTTDTLDTSTSGDEETDDAGTSSTGDDVDTTAPQIVSISPAADAMGVAADTNIVVTFDEPMDTTTTEGAFTSPDLGTFTASWNGEGTVLTIDPDDELAYAEGVNPAVVVALEYELSIGVAATDVAGNPLAAAETSSFSTLRRITTALASDAVLTGAVLSNGTLNTGAGGDPVVGDGTDNMQRKGFFALVIEDVPAGAEVVSASLSAPQMLTLGAPFPAFGSIQIDHVVANALDGNAFDVAPLAALGVFSNSATDGARTADITATVAADLTAGRDRSQYRLEFGTGTDNDAVTDRTRYDPATGELVYLVE